MIILDTCVLRGEGNGSSTEVLRAIRTAGLEGVAVPWMVMEELVEQHAVKYRKQYEATAQAFQSLGNVTPWDLDVRLPEIDMERVREHWRKHWSRVVDVVPTSESALREAAFREANRLPPCKDTDKKAGARDAAIWLSAVEYAKAHPDETVYFVSGNTTDFGDGKSYPDAMGTDVAELGERFVHLTGLGEVIDRFTVPTVTEQDVIKSALKSKPVLNAIIRLAHGIANISGTDSDLWLNTLSRQGFSCTTAGPNYEPVHARRRLGCPRLVREGQRDQQHGVLSCRGTRLVHGNGPVADLRFRSSGSRNGDGRLRFGGPRPVRSPRRRSTPHSLATLESRAAQRR
ncbi:PIN domain-containing protein [Streptomyces avermitilis]|uniref:PIN domain-containing protein n=1 Tax=Streptomyces avermitilis TaxID=33903 RepID=UPI0033AF0D78